MQNTRIQHPNFCPSPLRGYTHPRATSTFKFIPRGVVGFTSVSRGAREEAHPPHPRTLPLSRSGRIKAFVPSPIIARDALASRAIGATEQTRFMRGELADQGRVWLEEDHTEGEQGDKFSFVGGKSQSFRSECVWSKFNYCVQNT